MDRTCCVSCPYCNRETKQISSYKLQTNRLFSRYTVQHYIDIGTGDLLVGLSVRGVRVNTHFSVVPRKRASGAVDLYLTSPVRTANQGIFPSPVIDICEVCSLLCTEIRRGEMTCK